MSHLRKTTALLLAAMFVSATTQADDYQFELNLTGDHASIDSDGASDLDAIGVAGTYYFKPVPTDGVPLAEAAFLNKASSLTAAAVRSELGDEKIDIFGASFGYYIPNAMFYSGARLHPNADDFGGGDQSNLDAAWHHAVKGLPGTTDIDEDGWDRMPAKYVGRIADRNFYARASASLTRTRAISMWGSTSVTSWITFQRGADSTRIRRFLGARREFFKRTSPWAAVRASAMIPTAAALQSAGDSD
jgi:hypothetical protein